MFREPMFSTVSTVIVFSLVHYTCNAFLCFIGQMPDPKQGDELRWVLPYTPDERCRCTKVVFSACRDLKPIVEWPEHFYTDEPLILVNNDDPKSLKQLLGCDEDEDTTSTKSTIMKTFDPAETTPIITTGQPTTSMDIKNNEE